MDGPTSNGLGNHGHRAAKRGTGRRPYSWHPSRLFRRRTGNQRTRHRQWATGFRASEYHRAGLQNSGLSVVWNGIQIYWHTEYWRMAMNMPRVRSFQFTQWVCWLSLTLVCSLAWPLSLSADQAQFIYDELGRLVGVVDGQGNMATYQYDSVGNLLSVTQGAPTAPVITDISPSSLEAGSSSPITLTGSGFLLGTGTEDGCLAGREAVRIDLRCRRHLSGRKHRGRCK